MKLLVTVGVFVWVQYIVGPRKPVGWELQSGGNYTIYYYTQLNLDLRLFYVWKKFQSCSPK